MKKLLRLLTTFWQILLGPAVRHRAGGISDSENLAGLQSRTSTS
ncbi:hypothetical protein [Agathobaculum butyriciproducens]|nr:hypothetical protein [Agathobaculum butyriciproducens]